MSFNQKIKTPCYIVDVNEAVQRYNLFKSAIAGKNRDDIIAYSIKSNYSSEIISSLNNAGCWFEVCSDFEYKKLLQLGVPSDRIIVNGYTSIENIVEWTNNDSLVILDSFDQLKCWQNVKCENKIGLRINLNYFTKDERFKNKFSRFGIDVYSDKVKKIICKENIADKIICVQCHLSGNTREPSIYADVIEEIHNIIKEFNLNNIEYIDIGGGFKVGDGFWSFTDYTEVISKQCVKLGIKYKLIYEPGNSLVSSAVSYCTKVIAEKTLNENKIKIVDGSVLHLPNAAIKNLNYEIISESTQSKSGQICGQQIIAGATCKESDVILKIEEKPELAKGDIIVFKNVGAYCINEVNELILGKPNVFINGLDNVLYFQNYRFEKILKYKDCYKNKNRNDYTKINNSSFTNQKGLYCFVGENNEILYIGAAVDRTIKARVKQHFKDCDTGGLRYKLKKEKISNQELYKSELFVCPMTGDKKEILFTEAYLIGKYRPKYNFLFI